jgi:hypothetical protein
MVRAHRKYAFNPPKIRFPLPPFPHVSFTVFYSNQNTNPLPRRTSSAIGMIGTPPLFPDLTVSGWSSCGTPARFSPMHPVASCRRSRRQRYCFSFFSPIEPCVHVCRSGRETTHHRGQAQTPATETSRRRDGQASQRTERSQSHTPHPPTASPSSSPSTPIGLLGEAQGDPPEHLP